MHRSHLAFVLVAVLGLVALSAVGSMAFIGASVAGAPHGHIQHPLNVQASSQPRPARSTHSAASRHSTASRASATSHPSTSHAGSRIRGGP